VVDRGHLIPINRPGKAAKLKYTQALGVRASVSATESAGATSQKGRRLGG